MATIDIVGGGLGGLVLARNLLAQGAQVRVWERARSLSSMIGRTRISELGIAADRSHHPILPTDATLMGLIDELGLRPSLHARPTRMGFYHSGRTYPLNSALELLRFPPLSALDRARLGYTIMVARQIRDWRALDQVSALEWLRELGGERLTKLIWEPLLRARFDGEIDRVPATYIWSRLLRVASTHDTATPGQMCYLTGGHGQLIESLARDVIARGGTINLGASVEQVRLLGGRAVGLVVDGQPICGDGVALTTPTPEARTLLPPELAGQSERWGRISAYLDRICVLVVLRRRVMPYYMLNITDPRVPFTGIVETTNLIDPALIGGYHLVYLPRYIGVDSGAARMSDDELARAFTARLMQMFPDLGPADIAAVRTLRARHVEPLHAVGCADDLPPIVGDVPGLFLANSSQIYPRIMSAESVASHAGVAAEAILSTLRQGESRRISRPLVHAAAV
jgi:protoporphyrinogen oxidase